MKNFEEMTLLEREHILELVSNWLKDYSTSVIISVMGKIEEILADDFVLDMLEELYKREIDERKEFTHSIEMLMRDYYTFAKYDPHAHPMTHSNSYRDILYDRYIHNI